jgi:hypothetical protein
MLLFVSLLFLLGVPKFFIEFEYSCPEFDCNSARGSNSNKHRSTFNVRIHVHSLSGDDTDSVITCFRIALELQFFVSTRLAFVAASISSDYLWHHFSFPRPSVKFKQAAVILSCSFHIAFAHRAVLQLDLLIGFEFRLCHIRFATEAIQSACFDLFCVNVILIYIYIYIY